MRVLAIESTCDETGAAVVEKTASGVVVLSNVVASSAEIHTKYGGVVPEVAAREQIKSVIPVVREALEKAEMEPAELDAVAVAVGPGLIGSLLIGVETTKALALAWKKPLIAVNHMAGHIYANWIEQEVELPAIALVVSGGHTDLVMMESLEKWKWIGGTRDDAAGECFDKCARILGLGYPGGPMMEKAAEKVAPLPAGTPFKCAGVKLPRPMIYEDNLDLSFSGLKSAVDSLVRSNPELVEDEEARNLMAKEIREAVVEVLVSKTGKAVEKWNPKSVIVAGGVAASKRLRESLEQAAAKWGVKLYIPEFKYCTDNAAMIGAAAVLQGEGKRVEGESVLSISPRPGLETV